MADKDVASMISVLRNQVDGWVAVGLATTRALTAERLGEYLHAAEVTVVGSADQAQLAFASAQAECAAGNFERVLVFGSFLIVGPALDYLAL